MSDATRLATIRLYDTITSIVSVPMINGFEYAKSITFNRMGFKNALEYIKSYPGSLNAESNTTIEMYNDAKDSNLWQIYDAYLKTEPFYSEILLGAKRGPLSLDNCMMFPTVNEMKDSYEYKTYDNEQLKERSLYVCTDWKDKNDNI